MTEYAQKFSQNSKAPVIFAVSVKLDIHHVIKCDCTQLCLHYASFVTWTNCTDICVSGVVKTH